MGGASHITTTATAVRNDSLPAWPTAHALTRASFNRTALLRAQITRYFAF